MSVTVNDAVVLTQKPPNADACEVAEDLPAYQSRHKRGNVVADDISADVCLNVDSGVF